jgi:5S rRNA maturation endonuclease (ribonuclease M5)
MAFSGGFIGCPRSFEAKSSGYLICIVEGEKDADNLWKFNIPATTNCGGAGKWRNEYSETLRGAEVLIISDNDKPGRTHADQVGAALSDIANKIWWLDLAKAWPECPPKGDISDWIEAGGTAEELWKFIDASPLWKPREEQPESTPALQAQTFTAADLWTMTFEPIKYIVPGFIVEGLTLFAGKPKIGKSWLLMHAAWAVADSNYTLAAFRVRAATCSMPRLKTISAGFKAA